MQAPPSLNSPIGYSKSPFQHYPSLEFFKKRVRRSFSSKPPTRLTIECLPIEVLDRILNYISQFDLLHIIRLNKFFHDNFKLRLYTHIVIDSSFNSFDSEQDLQGTVINNLYNFKKFITLVNTNTVRPKIQSFICIKLPDSLNLFDHELNDQLLQFFKKLTSLNCLIWLSDTFKLEFLNNLPNKSIMKTLVLNIKYNNYLNELNEDEELATQFEFTNLQTFQIKPFISSQKLLKIINNLLINKSDNAKSVSDRLTCLSLTKFNNVKELENMQSDNRTILTLFKTSHLKYLPNLKTLSLNQFSMRAGDGLILKNSVDLNNLETLQLKGLIDVSPDSSFLRSIDSPFKKLKHLTLDMNLNFDGTYDFLSNIKSDLSTLDLTLTRQESSQMTFDDYSRMISKFNNLRKLSLEMYSLLNTYRTLESTIPESFYHNMQALDLTSLRINTNGNHKGLMHLIYSLKNLKYLDLLGDKAGGAPNLGLGMVHPTVHDDWFKVQHVVIYYAKFNMNIRYIRINERLFKLPDDDWINPIFYGLKRWFDDKVMMRID